jgi:alkaline phosphatase
MARTAIEILSQNNQRFFLVIEEEGSDNFANKNNANATFETIKRADDTIKLIREYSKSNKNTLLIVASDSEASGPELVAFPPERMKPDENLPNTDRNGSPMDGVNGSGTKPFISTEDKNGKTLPFGISWSSNDDVYGSVVVKAEGLNSELVKGNLDNTDIYRIMYATLFGKIIR